MVWSVEGKGIVEGIVGLGALEVGEVPLWRFVRHQLVVFRLRICCGICQSICPSSLYGSQVWEVARKSCSPCVTPHHIGICKGGGPRPVDGQDVQVDAEHPIKGIIIVYDAQVVQVDRTDVGCQVLEYIKLLSGICGKVGITPDSRPSKQGAGSCLSVRRSRQVGQVNVVWACSMRSSEVAKLWVKLWLDGVKRRYAVDVLWLSACPYAVYGRTQVPASPFFWNVAAFLVYYVICLAYALPERRYLFCYCHA